MQNFEGQIIEVQYGKCASGELMIFLLIFTSLLA